MCLSLNHKHSSIQSCRYPIHHIQAVISNDTRYFGFCWDSRYSRLFPRWYAISSDTDTPIKLSSFRSLAYASLSISPQFIMEEVVRLIASRDFPAAIEVAVANDLVDAVDEIHRANPKILDRIFWAGLKRVRPRIVEQAIRLGFLTVGRTTAKHNAIFGAIKHPAMLSLLLQNGFPVDAYATIRTHTASLASSHPMR